MTAETTERTKPFWMDDEEWKQKGLPKLEGNVADAVAGGVPDLKWVDKGPIIGAWVEKDGLLIYHFYKKDRKNIYDVTHEAMSKTNDPAQQAELAAKANAELDKMPWWENIKEVLGAVFKEHFRFHSFKIDYYLEVDSYSVVMTIPDTPVRWTAAQYEVPFAKVALQVGG